MSLAARFVGLGACLILLGCSQGPTGARLRVYTDEALSLRTNALCVRPLSHEGGFEQIRDDHLVLLSPSGSALDWRIEIQARSEPNCDAPGEPIVRRIVARRYRRGLVVDSLPDILLIDPCEGRCDPPRTTCVPCGEFYRAGAPLPAGCPSPSDAFPLCIPPEDAPWLDVTAEEDAALPSIDANEDAGALPEDANPLDAPGLDAPGLDAQGLDALAVDASGLDAPADAVPTPDDAFVAPTEDAWTMPDAGTDAFTEPCAPPNCLDTLGACIAEGDLCGDGGRCDSSRCTVGCDGCQIAGEGCVAEGMVNPLNVCEICDKARSMVAWSARDTGTSCRTGPELRTCRDGVCRDGCQGCPGSICSSGAECCVVGQTIFYSCSYCTDTGPAPLPDGTSCSTPGGFSDTCDGVRLTCMP